MKRIILFAVFILGIVSTACAQYQTNVLSSTNTAVKLRCTGYAKNKKKALAEAELAAIKAVLFHGIDNTQSQTALIPTTEQEAMKKHKSYFNNLYSGGYRDLISSSEIVQPFSKDTNKRKNIVVDVTVKVRVLREDLEKNGVIRRFGL